MCFKLWWHHCSFWLWWAQTFQFEVGHWWKQYSFCFFFCVTYMYFIVFVFIELWKPKGHFYALLLALQILLADQHQQVVHFNGNRDRVPLHLVKKNFAYHSLLHEGEKRTGQSTHLMKSVEGRLVLRRILHDKVKQFLYFPCVLEERTTHRYPEITNSGALLWGGLQEEKMHVTDFSVSTLIESFESVNVEFGHFEEVVLNLIKEEKLLNTLNFSVSN